jgi:flagellar biosynthetic protein FliR
MPEISLEQAQVFLLIFLRVGAVIVFLPVLGDRNVSVKIKGGLALLISALLFPHVAAATANAGFDIFSLFFRMGTEVMIGAAIGFTSQLLFSGIQMAGQLIGYQMGFSIANVIDPASSEQVSIISEFMYLLMLLIFLSFNGHHIFIAALAKSFQAVPVLGFTFSGHLPAGMTDMMKGLFEVAVKIGAPVMALMFFITIGMGLIARTVPQINIFIIGFPLQIAIGLVGLGLAMPLLMTLAGRYVIGLERDVGVILNLIKS